MSLTVTGECILIINLVVLFVVFHHEIGTFSTWTTMFHSTAIDL